jgi:hypothetical protein
MRASYSIFPESRYVQRSFRGAVTYPKLRYFTARQLRDPRLPVHYDSISDFSQATLHFTDLEVRNFAEWLRGHPKFSVGRRAVVVTNARNFAIASLFEQCFEGQGLSMRCFQTRDAATRWLKSERDAKLESILGASPDAPVDPVAYIRAVANEPAL